MRCRIGNNNLKVWGKAIQTLISTGDDEVHFQFTNSLVTITTFDASVTVSCSCSFEKDFFDCYDAITNEHGYLACRVPSKCLLKAFRSQRFLSKSVSACEIIMQENSDNLEIALLTKFGPVVRYSLRLAVETEALEIDCYPEKLSNWIKVNPKFILGTVSNFGPTNKIADLTLKTLDSKILLKNCTTDVVKREGKIYTELSVNSVDFAEYTIREDSEITVPLREFKAFVQFAEGLKLDLSMHFQGSKDPVIIVIQNELYKATLNLATKVLSGGNNSQVMSPATSGIISNVASQQSVADPVAQSPAAPLETSIRNVNNPVADSDIDSEEGIFDQVYDLESSKSFDISKRHSNPPEPERLEVENGCNGSRKTKSPVTDAHESVTESDVEMISYKVKDLGCSKTYADRKSRRRVTNAAGKRESTLNEMSGMVKSKVVTNTEHINCSEPDGDYRLSVNFNDEAEFGLIEDREIVPSNRNNVPQRGQPPKKKVKTFDSIFPNISTREIPFIPGMDIVLLPASDEEDC